MLDETIILDIRNDVKEIKAEVGEIGKKMAIHNHILQTHEQRSTTLKAELDMSKAEVAARVLPLEDDFKFRQKLYVLIMGTSGVIALLALSVSIASFLLHK